MKGLDKQFGKNMRIITSILIFFFMGISQQANAFTDVKLSSNAEENQFYFSNDGKFTQIFVPAESKEEYSVFEGNWFFNNSRHLCLAYYSIKSSDLVKYNVYMGKTYCHIMRKDEEGPLKLYDASTRNLAFELPYIVTAERLLKPEFIIRYMREDIFSKIDPESLGNEDFAEFFRQSIGDGTIMQNASGENVEFRADGSFIMDTNDPVSGTLKWRAFEQGVCVIDPEDDIFNPYQCAYFLPAEEVFYLPKAGTVIVAPYGHHLRYHTPEHPIFIHSDTNEPIDFKW